MFEMDVAARVRCEYNRNGSQVAYQSSIAAEAGLVWHEYKRRVEVELELEELEVAPIRPS